MADLIIFMGPTGAGKSIQARALVAAHDMVHVSSGELLRADPEQAVVLATGRLVPSEAVESLVNAAISRVPSETTVILDGFPRILDEAVWLEDHLATWGRQLRAVVLFEIDRDTSSARLSARGRADDTPEALDAKWDEYEHTTQPVIEHYRRQGALIEVDGRQSVENVTEQLRGIIL